MNDILAFGVPTSTKLATTDSQGMAGSSQRTALCSQKAGARSDLSGKVKFQHSINLPKFNALLYKAFYVMIDDW